MTKENAELLSLQVVFPNEPDLEPSSLKSIFEKGDPLFTSVEIDSDEIRFGGHTINFEQFAAPMNEADVNAAFGDIRCDAELKRIVQQHKAYTVLSYCGPESHPLAVYKLLTLVSAGFCALGSVAVLNCNGHTCVDARQLRRLLGDKNWFNVIDRGMPICFLCSAITAHSFDGNPYYFVRTYGNEFLNVPNVGSLVLCNQWSVMEKKIIGALENVTNYLLDSGKEIKPGDTIEIEQTSFRFCTDEESAKAWGREVNQPLGSDEFFLESPSGLLTLEFQQRSSILFLPGAGGGFFR